MRLEFGCDVGPVIAVFVGPDLDVADRRIIRGGEFWIKVDRCRAWVLKQWHGEDTAPIMQQDRSQKQLAGRLYKHGINRLIIEVWETDQESFTGTGNKDNAHISGNHLQL